MSYGKATTYLPVIDLLKRYCHVDDSDDTRIIRAKVTGQICTLDETLQDTLPALLALLDAVPDDSAFLQLDPPQRCQRTREALKRVLLHESQVQPLLLVFEDLHWIDTETQALLDRLAQALPAMQGPATVQAILAARSTGCRRRRSGSSRPRPWLAPSLWGRGIQPHHAACAIASADAGVSVWT